jgi:RimJ/RimL family protein N-acetyltransferase
MKTHFSETARVFLRPLEIADAGTTVRWRLDSELYESLVGVRRFIPLQTEENWIRDIMNHRGINTKVAICLKSNGAHIGNVYLEKVDHVSQNAEFGILIGEPSSRGKGLGTEATMLMLNYAFNDLNLQRVCSSQLETNLASISMHKKCGFKEEGLLRRAVYKNGEFLNLSIMGVLREEFDRLL